MSSTFLVTSPPNGPVSSAGQFCYSVAINTPTSGNVTLYFYEDATKQSTQGRIAFQVQMSNAEAAAMGGHLSSPSNGTGP